MSSAFGKLNKHMKKSTNIGVYRAIILAYMAQSCGSLIGITYNFLNNFTRAASHTILNIYWSDFLTNIEVFEKIKFTSIEAMLLKSQLCLQEWGILISELSAGHHD